MLSKENYDKLNENFLYSKDPDKNKNYLGGAYWCRNWTFKVCKLDTGKAFMYDTYWSSASEDYIEVTDENINDFKFIFDFREVIKIRDTDIDEYDISDLICAATDSGGMTCGHNHWIKKGALKSNKLLIEKTEKEIERLKRKLANAERYLKMLEEV